MSFPWCFWIHKVFSKFQRVAVKINRVERNSIKYFQGLRWVPKDFTGSPIEVPGISKSFHWMPKDVKGLSLNSKRVPRNSHNIQNGFPRGRSQTQWNHLLLPAHPYTTRNQESWDTYSDLERRFKEMAFEMVFDFKQFSVNCKTCPMNLHYRFQWFSL